MTAKTFLGSSERHWLLGPVTGVLTRKHAGKKVKPLSPLLAVRSALVLEKTGGLLRIVGDQYQEHLMTVWLRTIGGKLKIKGKTVLHISGQFGEQLPDLADFDGPVFLLVEDAPYIEAFAEQLQKLRAHKAIVIATGLDRDWQALDDSLTADADLHISRADPDFEILAKAYRAEALVVSRVIYSKFAAADTQTAYRYAAFFDSCKVILPTEMLVGISGVREDILQQEEAAKKALLTFSHDGRWTCASGWFVSEALLSRLAEDAGKSQEGLCQEIILDVVRWLATTELASGRQALRRLLRGLWLRRRLLFLRRLVTEHWQTAFKPVVEQETQPREMLHWARLLGDAGCFSQSAQLFKSALAKQPDNPYLLTAYGKMLGEWAIISAEQQQASRYRQAESQLKAALDVKLTGDAESGRDAYVFQIHGDLAAKLGHYKTAADCFEYAAGLAADTLHLLIARAHALIRQAEVDDVAAETIDNLLDQAIKVNPDNLRVHHLRGVRHMRRWQHQAAEDCFQHVLELDPENVQAMHALGTLALQRGHLAAARQHLAEAEKRDPENVQLLTSLGDCQIEIRDYRLAGSFFTRGLQLEPDNRHILVSRVKLCLLEAQDNADYSKAEQALRQAEASHPGSEYVMTISGQLALAKGDLVRAEKLLSKVKARRTKAPAATLNLLAKVLALAGKPERAQQLFEQTSRQEPGNQQTLCAWADMSRTQCAYDEAQALLDKALSIDAGNAYVIYNLGRLRQAEDNQAKVDQHYLQARALGLSWA